MSNWVKFMLYCHGNVIVAADGVRYDKGPTTMIKVDVGTKYGQLVELIASELEIDLRNSELDIQHRYAIMEIGRTEFVLIPIKNDKDVFLLIDFALEIGKDKCQQLFVSISSQVDRGRTSCVDAPMVAANRPVYMSTHRMERGGPSSREDGITDENNPCEASLFEVNSSTSDSSLEKEVPLPYFQGSGGDGYIRFEADMRRTDDKWSFSDELKKGMRWDTKNKLIHAVKMHHVLNHRDFKVDTSKSRLWCVSCVNEDNGCKWRLRAFKKKGEDAFEITVVDGPHTCVNPVLNRDHRQLDSAFLSKAVDNHVRDAPDVAVSVVRTVIADKFGYDVPWRRAYEAKKKAIVNVYGDWDESYSVLPNLLHAIQETNEGTVVEWYPSSTNSEPVVIFERVFWAYGPCIEAFKHIRPVVSIDGTFLYGKYKHKLLIACGMDGANHIVPLAFALVEEESRSSWSWFLKSLKCYVVKDVEGPICLISDRHAGIRAAVENDDVGWRPPFGQWRFCIRHVTSNFNDHVKNNACKDIVLKAAMQAQPMKCMKYLEEVRKLKPDALRYLNEMPYEQWTLAHDGGFRFGYMTTNLSESYNAIIKGARKLPVASLVKKTFYNCVGYFKARRAEALGAIDRGEKYTKFCDDKFQRWSSVACMHSVVRFTDAQGLFDVTTGFRTTPRGLKGGHRQIVDVKAGKCTCNKWQTYRIPCSHACAAYGSVAVDISSNIGGWYSWSNQLLCYQSRFNPYPVEAYWTQLDFPVVLPNPDRKRIKGRPRSTRIHNEMDIREASTTITCGICRQTGHNRRTCTTNRPSTS